MLVSADLLGSHSSTKKATPLLYRKVDDCRVTEPETVRAGDGESGMEGMNVSDITGMW